MVELAIDMSIACKSTTKHNCCIPNSPRMMQKSGSNHANFGGILIVGNSTVEDIWKTYDKDNSGFLDKKETRLFVSATLGEMGEKGDFSEAEFEACFKEFDKDGNLWAINDSGNSTEIHQQIPSRLKDYRTVLLVKTFQDLVIHPVNKRQI